MKQHACGNSGQNVPPLKSNKPVGDVLMKNNCTKQNKQNVLRPTDMEDKIHNLCYNIITKYEKLNNLDVRIHLSLLLIIYKCTSKSILFENIYIYLYN